MEKQIDQIMMHTLGITEGDREYRNYFVAAEGHHDWATLIEAERQELMARVESPSFLSSDSVTFIVTDAGKVRARAAKLAARPKVSRGSARYSRWLEVEDYFPDWRFGDWLKAGCPQ
jgi:hypothetical protein